MSARDTILTSLRQHTTARFPLPDLTSLEQESLRFDDPVAQFKTVMEQVGGRAVLLDEGETPGQCLARLYPDVTQVALAVPDLAGRESLPGQVFDPDGLAAPAELNGTELAVVPALFGVCENGCCWIEQSVRHRALYFIAEALAIVLRRTDLVHNMHEAYARLADKPELGYGCFISGPSKTADIEQALVMGAHGAREVTVLLC